MDKYGKYELRRPTPPEPEQPIGQVKKEDVFDLNDTLRWNHIKSGVIFIRGEIDEHALECFRLELDEVFRQRDSVDIEIHSGGGDSLIAFSIYDIIRLYVKSGKKVNITASGLSGSAAIMIIMQAAVERKATKNTWFVLHQPVWSLSDGVFEHTDLENKTSTLKKLKDQVFGILSKRCGKSVEELDKMTRHTDVWLSAKEALDFGLIDYIL